MFQYNNNFEKNRQKKKLVNSTEGHLRRVKIPLSKYSEIPLRRIFFKIFVHFPFQVPKAITKKNHGVTELVFKLFEP